MKTAVVSMIKNEIDIIDAFLEHIDSCFDVAYLCDNMSNDGTYEKIVEKAKQTGKIKVFRLDSKSYIQSALISHLVNRCFNDVNPDVMIMLDADEFLPFRDSASLKEALAAFNTDLVFMNWNNMGLVSDGRLVNTPTYQSKIQKVIIYRSAKTKIGRIVVDAGAHNIKKSRRLQSTQADFSLIHIPIRSKEQFIKKLFIGNISLILSREKIGYHWKLLGEYCFANMPLIADIALKYGVRYGEKLSIDEILATDLSLLQNTDTELDWLVELLAYVVTSDESNLYNQIFDAINQCSSAATHDYDGVLYDNDSNTLKIFKMALLTKIQQLFRLK